MRSSEEVCSSIVREHQIRPYILASWKAAQYGGPLNNGSGSGHLVADARAVHESVKIPGTRLYLNYVSSHASGHQSSLWMYLTPEHVPSRLRLVKLKIDVEGNLFQKTLEAKPGLTYSYGWDKRNVYRQKVYGLTAAKGSVPKDPFR